MITKVRFRHCNVVLPGSADLTESACVLVEDRVLYAIDWWDTRGVTVTVHPNASPERIRRRSTASTVVRVPWANIASVEEAAVEAAPVVKAKKKPVEESLAT